MYIFREMQGQQTQKLETAFVEHDFYKLYY